MNNLTPAQKDVLAKIKFPVRYREGLLLDSNNDVLAELYIKGNLAIKTVEDFEKYREQCAHMIAEAFNSTFEKERQ